MPIYNFRCAVCGEEFEKRMPLDERSQDVKCPNGHGETERVYSPPAIVFKGSGFYVTDHRSGGTNGASK